MRKITQKFSLNKQFNNTLLKSSIFCTLLGFLRCKVWLLDSKPIRNCNQTIQKILIL